MLASFISVNKHTECNCTNVPLDYKAYLHKI